MSVIRGFSAGSDTTLENQFGMGLKAQVQLQSSENNSHIPKQAACNYLDDKCTLRIFSGYF